MNRTRTIVRWRILGILLAVLPLSSGLAGWLRQAEAGIGTTATFPQKVPKGRNSGLILRLDSYWFAGTGYRPLDIQISTRNGRAVKADRRLRVEVTLSDWGISSPTVVTDLVLAEKTAAVSKRISVPTSGNWQRLKVNVYENGRAWADLSTGWNETYLNSNYHEWTEAIPSLLFIEPNAPLPSARPGQTARMQATAATYDLPDIQKLVHTTRQAQVSGGGLTTSSNRLADTVNLQMVQNMPKVEMLPPSYLANDWLQYTGLDLAFISLETATTLNASNPELWEPLVKWVKAGGNLIVYGADEGYAKLGEIEALLKIPSERGIEHWDRPGLKLRDSFTALEPYRRGVPRFVQPGNQPAEAQLRTEDRGPAASLEESPFLYRRAGLGHLVAIEATDPFPGKDVDWQWMLNTLGPENIMWFERHGFSQIRRNDTYWNWLIPDVGMPPVTTFLILITLFAVVIGPINFVFLRRVKRLYLVLVTVPLGAFLVTGALVAYAVVSDGLGVKLRQRSLVHLDQRTGEVLSLSKQTYYASLTPSGGMVLPDETAVFEIQPLAGYNNRSNEQDRRLQWLDEEGEQRLTAGYLRPRIQMQYMLTYNDTTKARLRIRETSEGIDVTNELGGELTQLIVVDSQGRFFRGENVQVKQPLKLKQATLADCAGPLRAKLASEPLAYPDSFDPSSYRNFSSFWMGYYAGGNDNGFPAPNARTSLLERELSELQSNLGGLPPRSYVAVFASLPLCPVGLERAKAVGGVNVIRGRW